jgi:hypothetical protein
MLCCSVYSVSQLGDFEIGRASRTFFMIGLRGSKWVN